MGITQGGFEAESQAMRLFRKMGMDSIAWSLRRLHCPVDEDALVLEVGSGASPYFRANVLCDAYEETQERFFTPLVHDRPTVLAFVEELPFKDDAFDFVIASHVLEHSAEPEKFLAEIQRVAKAGYIEVPDAFMERLTHYGFHRLEITDDAGGLIIRKKKWYIQDEEVVGLFHNKARPIFPKWAARFPFQFHVRYYWSKDTGGIRYEVLNPECPADWEAPQLPTPTETPRLPLMATVKQKTLAMVRRLFSQSARNKSIDLLALLKCAQCGSSDFAMDDVDGHAVCSKCGASHSIYFPSWKGSQVSGAA
jgi:SAM-dependent methyltransferase